jgi:hypothetical protein
VERHTFGNNGHGRYDDKPATLKASGGDYPGGENVVVENRYIVRRLTPQECALLQGYLVPDEYDSRLIDGLTEEKELFAGNGMVAFLAKERVDGKLLLPEAVQVLKIKAGSGS